MANKKKKPEPNAPSQSAAALSESIRLMNEEGYVAMPMRQILGSKADSSMPGWEDVLNITLRGDGKSTSAAGNDGLFASVGSEQVISTVGTPGKGWMEWGAGNRLPNTVALLTSLLPYTAAGVKFNTDTAAGLGPQPKYRYSIFSNGTIKTEEIDYSAAGQLIEGQLIEARARLGKHYADCRAAGIDLSKVLATPKAAKKSNSDKTATAQGATPSATAAPEERYMQLTASAANNTAPAFGSQPGGERTEDGRLSVTDAEIRVNQQIEQRLLKQIFDAEEAYAKWELTNADINKFTEKNNLDLITLQLFGDMASLGICFPEIQLSQQGLQRDTALWTPVATGLEYRSALTCRLERMDEDNRINYVYVSNRWMDQPYVDTDTSFEIDAIPALDPRHPVSTLRKHIRTTRLSASRRKKQVATEDRPTRFILPSYYPTLGRPYYPQPAWWSIFGGEIYSYASTIISDRATRKKNTNSIGRIIYIHLDYLSKIYLQEKAMTKDERDAIRNKMWNEINEFLNNPGSKGQSLLSFTFMGADGKEHDAYRIVEVPYNSKTTADANKTELEELGSIIFFALEIHPDLIGAVPGRSGSSGGTYQREMYLMKQMMMAPTQNIVLKSLETVSRFNEWDEHLVWRIKQMTLTTLDRNKNGMEEQKA